MSCHLEHREGFGNTTKRFQALYHIQDDTLTEMFF